MKTNVINNLTRTFNKVGFKISKRSPEILVVAGIAGVVTSTVMACKATTKLSGILEDSKAQIEQIHDAVESENYTEVYSEEDSKKDLAIVYVQTGVKLAKLYGPAIIVGALSITGILSSHRILTKRNVALAAAYAGVDQGFKDYRNRVIERFGKELDRELKYNIKAKQIDEVTIDEDGKETTVTKVVKVVDPARQHSDYARFYDVGCLGWTKDPEMNLMFLRRQQDHANELLKSKGHLFLNDVYEMLGIQHSKAGQIVGWIYDEVHPVGDNYIDFGIYDVATVNPNEAERKRAFVNGYERTILLDFNVDGNIWDMM